VTLTGRWPWWPAYTLLSAGFVWFALRMPLVAVALVAALVVFCRALLMGWLDAVAMPGIITLCLWPAQPPLAVFALASVLAAWPLNRNWLDAGGSDDAAEAEAGDLCCEASGDGFGGCLAEATPTGRAGPAWSCRSCAPRS
jgi:hypothetical protein